MPETNDTYLSSFNDEGVVVLDSVYSPDELATLRKISNARTELIKQHCSQEKAFVRDDNAWMHNPIFRSALFSQKLNNAACKLLNTDRVRIYHTAALFKEPSDTEVNWHQDNYLSPLDANIISAWIPLVDMPEQDIGTMSYALKSYKHGILVLPAGIKPFTSEADQFYIDFIKKNNLKQKCYPLKAGDVAIHHGSTLHMSPPNVSNRTREALTIFMYPDGAKMAKYDNSFKANEARLYFPALLPGDLAKSPLNPVMNEHI